jgi:EAL and modified HD-GYP domain-containing signal transduction protein
MTLPGLQDVFLGRQPILARNQQLFAYELLFRSAGGGNAAKFVDGNLATATVIVNAFSELSLADALGPYQAFIKVDQGLLFSDLLLALPPKTVVLEILDTVEQTPELIARAEQLRQAGYLLATRVRPESLDFAGKPLLRIVEFIKLDVSRAGPERISQIARALKPLRKTLIAEKVENNDQMQSCHDLGFDLFQGYYFAHPTVVEGKRMRSSEASLLRLLGLIGRDADTAEVEAVFKQEPVLTINLLRLANSSSSGLTTQVASLRHAIVLLGRRQLIRWLQLLLYSGASSSAPAVNPLLQLAATRGRLMELLVDHTPEAAQYGRDFVDQAFMVGILSLMPTVLCIEAEDLFAQLPLAKSVLTALNEHQGVLGDLLTLVEIMEEDGSLDKAAAALQNLPGLDASSTGNCLARALGWANNLAKQSP